MKPSLLVVMLVGGCGGSNSTAADLSMPDLSPVADMAPAVSVTGTIGDDSKAPMAGNPVVGAMVCLYPQMTPCAPTNSTGAYQLDGLPDPSAGNVAVAISAAGFITDIFPLPVGWDSSKTLSVLLYSSTNDPLIAAAGVARDTSKGMVIATLFDDSDALALRVVPAGSTVSIQPAAGDGPFYINSSTSPPTSSTTGGTTGPLVDFMNVPPGSYSLTATVTGKTCAALFGWPASGGGITGPSVPAGAALSLVFGCH